MTPEMAQRWVVNAHIDENTCQPCKDNDGKTYRNRQQAYADYPGGKGYTKCKGRSRCRCVVNKRGRKAGNSMDARMQCAAELVGSKAFSARALAAVNLAKLGQQPYRDVAPNADLDVAGFRAAAPVEGKRGQLYLYDAIGGWDGIMAIDVVKALDGMTGDLDIHINSGGGSIFEGVAIHNAIAGYQGGTRTAYVDSVAASAASFIAMATDKVVMADGATLMVHDGAGIAMGTAADMRDMADVLDMLSDNIARMYARKTGGTAEEWREIMSDGDTWYNAQEAVAAGLADRVAGIRIDGEDAEATNALDLGIFTARASGDESPDDKKQSPLTASAVDGLREALKGAFAA